jgi:hypothetical protein
VHHQGHSGRAGFLQWFKLGTLDISVAAGEELKPLVTKCYKFIFGSVRAEKDGLRRVL